MAYRESLTPAEFRRLLAKPPHQRKFRNVPTTVGGVRYDSKKEAARAGELAILERIGEISKLERQREFALVVNGVHIAVYRCDFAYLDHDGRLVVEDVKGAATRKDPVYRLKNKLMRAIHGIEIREV